MQLAVARLGLSPTWASLLGYAAGQTVSFDDFCANDPPAFPTITPEDALALTTFDPIGSVAALGKLASIILRAAWFEFCECSSVATPGPGSAPAYPTDVPVINPTGPLVNQPCQAYSYIYPNALNQNSPLFGQFHPIPSGVTSFRFRTSWFIVSGGPVTNVQYYFRLYASDQTTVLSERIVSHPPPGTQTLEWDMSNVTGATYVRAGGFYTGSTANVTGSVERSAYCGGNGPGTDPCGDSLNLTAILQALAYIRGQVDLIQRQAVPFSYIASTVHSGLTGNGSINIFGLLGAKIVLDSIPTSVTQYDGTPDTLFDAGHINWGNADGFKRLEHIGSSPMVSLPRECGQYTVIGYSFPPGVEATITELVRES